MLTDVFFRRYANRPMFESVGGKEVALFVQAYRIVNEQIWRYYGNDKKIDESVKAIWSGIHDRLSMEIGVKQLSSKYYSYQTEWMGKPHTNSGSNPMNYVVEQWLNFKFTDNFDADMFIKRLSTFPSNSAPPSLEISPPSNDATISRRPTRQKPSCSGLHSVAGGRCADGA